MECVRDALREMSFGVSAEFQSVMEVGNLRKMLMVNCGLVLYGDV